MPASPVAIEETLKELIDLPRCVLRFDASLVDDLPHILKENFGIDDVRHASRAPALVRLLSQLDVTGRIPLSDLPRLIEGAGVDKAKFRPLADEDIMKANAQMFGQWSMTTVDENKDAVIDIQRDLGMGQYNADSKRHDTIWPGDLKTYMRGVTSVPATPFQRLVGRSFWELRILWWMLIGLLKPDVPSLSVGPRWVTEIIFFRERLGLKRHVGLDLFSDDDGLVVAGDMHAMKFPDRHFQLVFIKNTVDKSFDVRRLANEILRVLRPGGLVVIDQISGYGDCSPLTRTDIQRAENLVRVFKALSPQPLNVLVQEDIALTETPGRPVDRARFNSRIALQV
ncbi:class I SAM-dependent methyltransferase [Bradyrhizobium sp. HKCCYLS2038]|uniref:class I SAM-dependent methyltransferase n=1 Tax=unclassified Bradyrhizobium TaxID=2631580 RepID=UPI003EBB87CE